MTELQGLDSPFVCGKMIKDPEKFWGRKDEVRQIFSHLNKMESISIIGERRIGKSSLAYNVFSTSEKNLKGNYQFVWLDGQSNHLNSVDSFFSHVSSQGSFGYITGKDHNECLVNFENAIQHTCQKNKKKVVLIINEFGLLTNTAHQQEFNEKFFLTLRLLAEQEDFALVTTSKRPLTDLCMHILPISSPFYNVFIQIPLKEFSQDDANNFLKSNHEGASLTDTEIDFVKSIPYYQHPLRLQVACHYVFINRQFYLSENAIKSNIIDRTEALMSHSDVEQERAMAKNHQSNKPNPNNKISELIAAVLVPTISIALFIGVLTFALQYLDNFQAALVAILSSIIGFAVMVFAARFVGIINESTFSRLFSQLTNKLSLLSRESKTKKK